MKATRILTIVAMTMALSANTAFAQSEQQRPNGPQRPERQQPTDEEMIEMRTKQMQGQLMLDEATAAKFAAIYTEYLTALKDLCPARPEAKEVKEGEKPEPKAEPTDAEIKEMITKRIQTQRQIADIQEKYLGKLSSVLSARQLQKVFAPQGGPQHGKGPGQPGQGKGGMKGGQPGGPQMGPQGQGGQPGQGCPQGGCPEGGQPDGPQGGDRPMPIESK